MKKRVVKKKYSDFHDKIEICRKYEKEIKEYLDKLQDLFFKEKITLSEYQVLLDSKSDGKTLHEWLDFYRGYILECEREIKEQERKVVTNKIYLIGGLFLMFIVVFLFVFDVGFENPFELFLAPPPITSVVLNATDNPLNRTIANLTAYVTPAANSTLKHIYNWYLDNVSIAVLNMPFEGNEGNEATGAKDYSGRSNDGIIMGPTWNSIAGYDGFGAYEFSNFGSSDYIFVPDAVSLRPTEVTVSAWIKPDLDLTSETNLTQGIIQKNEFTVNGNGKGYGIWYLGEVSGTPFGMIRYCTGAASSLYNCADYTVNLTAGEWHHIVLVAERNASNTGINKTGYFDGVKVTSSANADVIDYTIGDELWIGKIAGQPGIMCPSSGVCIWNGTIDDVRIYNGALSAEQIQALYNNRTDSIVSQETSVGDYWYVQVTPNDRVGDGISLNSTPIIINAFLDLPPAIINISQITGISPTEGSFTPVNFNFLITDPDSNSNINDTSVNASFSRSGEETRESLNCIRIGNLSIFTANYSCSIDMQYFDSGGIWNITVNAMDLDGNAAINNTASFTYGLLTSIVISPNIINWDVSIGGFNQSANNHPTTVNNTGNVNRSLKLIGIDLYGETDSSFSIPAANFSVHATSGSECTGTVLVNGTSTTITSSLLDNGNLSLGGGVAQETIFYCLIDVPFNIPSQQYSTLGGGSWVISLVISIFIKNKRKRKHAKKDKLVMALNLICEESEKEPSLSKQKLIESLKREIKKKYGLSDDDLVSLIKKEKETEIPIEIFSRSLGGLEAICKYLRENLGMSYHEIAVELNRDDRTVWTAYNKARQKQSKKLNSPKNVGKISFSLNIFKNRNLTVLESIVLYLKSKKMKYSEIAELLDRDQRNIWKIHSNAKYKLKQPKV
ncbi:MAG: LamG-like jellyroll fold domain-containing protein [Candidatus Nanoarchaeia archaeon]